MNKAVIFDLDGTIYFGNEIADFALEVIHELKVSGYDILFFTNNSTKTRVAVMDKLISLGVTTELEKIYTSSYASAMFLKENGINGVFLVGSDGFKKELLNVGINVASENECAVVVVGLDLGFNYEILSRALTALRKCRKVVAANVDKN